MTHCLGHGHFSNPTDTGTAHRSRARRVHRAPHPRASTASLNPAERSAAEIHRESHSQPAGCSRATLGFDIQLSGVRHPRLVRPDRPSARVTSRSRTRAASACFLSRDTADTRLTDERLLDRRCARADDSRGSQSCPRLASSLPNPPRGVLSSTHAAPETRVICDRFANRGRSRVSPGALSAGRHALTPLPISTPSTSSLTPACPSQPCPEKINCSWVRHARKRRGAVRGGPL